MTEANLVILASENGRDQWTPVKPEDVPAWVKEPDNVSRMMAGYACVKCDEGEKGSLWYRAVPPDEFAQMAAAQHRRDERNAKRLLH